MCKIKFLKFKIIPMLLQGLTVAQARSMKEYYDNIDQRDPRQSCERCLIMLDDVVPSSAYNSM